MSDTPTRTAERAEAARLLGLFQAAGAEPVETAILQPAGALLDLYGEDIRARAFTTSDPLHGEQMLRPDFTVPVVQRHMAIGAPEARYAYAGEVFRRQEDDPERAREYLQVGFERFGGADPAVADAEVLALFAAALSPFALRLATGDIGILTAAVRGLCASDRRKAALLRHLWRPRRFRALIDRFGGKTPVPGRRTRLLAQKNPFRGTGAEIGLRSRAEIETRLAALRADAAEPPLSQIEVDLLDRILALQDRSSAALVRLRALAGEMPAILGAVTLFERRLDALDRLGLDVETLDFEASYGRTSMEYYDGFVFGFYAEGRDDLPPIATGGRYDALTRVLGQGRTSPAVGGVIRPDLALLPGMRR